MILVYSNRKESIIRECFRILKWVRFFDRYLIKYLKIDYSIIFNEKFYIVK